MLKASVPKQNFHYISYQVLTVPMGASTIASVKKNLLLDRKTVKAELSYSSKIFMDLNNFWLSHQGPPAHTSSGSQKTGNSDYLAAWCRVLNQRLILKIVLAVHFFWEVLRGSLQFWESVVGI